MPRRGEILKQQFAHSLGLPFSAVLPTEVIEQALADAGVSYYNSVYNPVVTLWAFLSQMIDPDKSLRNAVSRIINWLSQADQPVPSPDNGANCKARQRLPERLPVQLMSQTAESLEERVPPAQLWCGRPVRICDMAVVSSEDIR